MATERRKCLVILGLQDSSSEEEIRKAYKKLALQYHPDKNDSDDAKGKFQEIGYAYKYLTDGPSAFGTTDPHDVREELLRRMFEEMFFAQFRGPFSGFHFFCEESDDDDYYMYNDSSDDECYCGTCDTKGAYGKGRRKYQNTFPRQPSTQQSAPPLSKKQIRKREKRQRQKERVKEKKEHERKEKKATRNLYTDDVNPEPRSKGSDKDTKSGNTDNFGTKSEDKNNSENSRPDTPVLSQQAQKPNKKQKKKMESEQRKREREMEEIAAELKKKQEREMEKQREKEKLAAQKREEEKENDINFSHFFDNGKKSRKARQREKKRQESGSQDKETIQQRENYSSSVPLGKPQNNVNRNRNSSGDGKVKERSGAGISKSQTKKPGAQGNIFDILNDIDDDVIRPLSRGSESSSGSQKKSHAEQSPNIPRRTHNSGATVQSTGFAKPSHGIENNFKSHYNGNGLGNQGQFYGAPEMNKPYQSRTFQNSNQNNSNSGSFERNNAFKANGNASFARQGSGFDRNINEKNANFDKQKSPTLNRSLSDDIKSGLNEFDKEEREYVKDWSVYYSDEDDGVENIDIAYGEPHFMNNQNASQYYGHNSNFGHDSYEYGYDSLYNHRTNAYQQNGYPKRREFIPRTRGYHNPDFRPHFGGPPRFPPYMRGPPPFSSGGMYPPPRPAHYRGGYHARPPFGMRNGGYQGPKYGPPMGMPGQRYGEEFGTRMPYGGPFHGNVPDDLKRNIRNQGHTSNHTSPKKSFKDGGNVKDASNEPVLGETRPTGQVTNDKSTYGIRVPSPSYIGQEKSVQDGGGQFAKNIFSNIETNQAGLRGSLDSLDDFGVYETGPISAESRTARGPRPETPPSTTSPFTGLDMGLDGFLSKDNLGVPAGMFSDHIKNYYK